MRTLSRTVVVLSLFFLPAAAQAKAKVTLTPSQTTVATTQTQELTAVVTGTTNKNVKFHVCDSNGQNCVLGGDGTRGILVANGVDANNNPIVTYSAPAALPSATLCQAVDTGCRLKVRALLKVGRTKIKKFATVTLTAPGVTSSPTGGSDGNSNRPARSANGRFVAFASAATTLIGPGNDTNGAIKDVFLFDTCIGATGCTPGMKIVSVADDGTQGDGDSDQPSISADGRFVTFVSSATNLLGPGGDTNGLRDIYVRDTCAGQDVSCLPTTSRVSQGSEPDGFSDSPGISGNGRYIVFRSAATNLLGAGNDTNGKLDIFLRDTCAGQDVSCVPSTVRASVDSSGAEANNHNDRPAVSADGRYVVFESTATNLVSGTVFFRDIVLRDTCTGVTGCTPATTRVSVDTGDSDPSAASEQPVISGNGRYVVFRSFASDLVVGDANSLPDIFLRDTCLGAGGGCTPSTMRVSEANDGSEATGGAALEPVMSSDGRFIAFRSGATNLIGVGNDANNVSDIFVRDTCQGGEPGCTPSTRRLSVTTSGGEGAADSATPSLSGDGRFAAFISAADLTGGGGAGAFENVYLARTGAVIVPLAWVTNHDDGTVSVIDTETNTVIATIPVGNGAKGILLNADGTRAYVTNYDDDSVSVIDTADKTVVATILSVGDGPWGLTFNRDGSALYVSNNLADTMSAISTTSHEVFATIALSPGASPRGMGRGQTGVGTLAYGLNEIEVVETDPGDINYHTVEDIISTGATPAGGALRHDASGDVDRIWVSLESLDRVRVIDTGDGGNPDVVVATIVVGNMPAGAALTPDLSRVYVANSGANTVSVISTSSNSVIKTITVGSNPTGVAITPDGARVYVTNRGSNTVSVIDTSTNAVVATIAVGAGPCCDQGIAIQLGRSSF